VGCREVGREDWILFSASKGPPLLKITNKDIKRYKNNLNSYTVLRVGIGNIIKSTRLTMRKWLETDQSEKQRSTTRSWRLYIDIHRGDGMKRGGQNDTVGMMQRRV
jgi:hypothetical protein